MSATTQVTTFSDLYTDLQNRVRVTTAVTATENQAKRYINIALHDMHIGYGEKFPWAERDTVLRTHAPYSTGTVTVTNGSTTVTGASTAWNTANAYGENNIRAGGKMTFGGTDVYEVSSVASDTSLTLTTRYIGSTESARTYNYFEDEYALASDFLRPLDLQSFDIAAEIELLDRKGFRQHFARSNTTGTVVAACLLDKAFSANTTPVRKVRLWRPPSTTLLIPYAYITSNLAVTSAGVAATQLSSDTDEPIVPLRLRHAIVFHALYHWSRDKKDDARSTEVKSEFEALILRAVHDQEVGAKRPQLRPRVSAYKRRAQQPWDGARSGGRYTTGSRFDEVR